MRIDFLRNAVSNRLFTDILQNSDIKLGAMNREELTEVIEEPIKHLGITFQAGLVERIVDNVENEPGDLSLLEFALTELWKKRTGKQLTHDAYKAMGQVKGALAQYANEEYKKLTSEQKKQARRIFIQLVNPNEETKDTKQRIKRSELRKEDWNLITQKKGLADVRLVVTGQNEITKEETVEIVHESLIKNWNKLKKWIDVNREDIKLKKRIAIAANEWDSSGRKNYILFRGKNLREALQLKRKNLEYVWCEL